jgi:hypothetical protein
VIPQDTYDQACVFTLDEAIEACAKIGCALARARGALRRQAASEGRGLSARERASQAPFREQPGSLR